MRDLVLARVCEEVGEGTRVVIGHSLGSVAYEYVCRYWPPSVELLVTLGSPLGIPNLVFERLTPAPAEGAGAWPGRVASWVNLAAAEGQVACVIFDRVVQQRRARDIRVVDPVMADDPDGHPEQVADVGLALALVRGV